MSTSTQEVSSSETKNDKEYNFRALEAKYERQLSQERSARVEAEKVAQELQKRTPISNDDDDDDDTDPYVDKKKLARKLNSFEKKMEETINVKAEQKARQMLNESKKEDWMRRNPDFYQVLQHAEAFAEADPELAETILQMPDGFERQKLVYRSIKTMGIDKPKQVAPSIQEKIDANRRSPYYQPSQMGTAPYSNGGDFSSVGQKSAYDKMQELKRNIRL